MSNVLVVPVRVDALCLTNDFDVTGPAADFTRLPYVDPATGHDRQAGTPYVSEILLQAPFQDDGLRLKAGVHLHWSLPDALTRLVQSSDGATQVPAVPDRWLVTRSRAGTVERQWVVESDYLGIPGGADTGEVAYPFETTSGPPYRRLGRRVPLNAWQRDPDASYLRGLGVVGYGEPSFAAFYPNCHSVFGLHDPTYVGVPPSGVSYDVVGWYDDLGEDVAAGLPAGEGWIQALADELSWTVPEGAAKPDRLACFARITFQQESPPRTADDGDDAEPGVYVGTSATEALAAHLGSVLPGVDQDETESLLEAIAYADELESGSLDLGRKLAESRHADTFRDVPGGTLWTVRREDLNPAEAEQRQRRERLILPEGVADLLNSLNRAQIDLDSAGQALTTLREQLFTDWYRYQLCLYPYETARESYPDPDEVAFYLKRRIARLNAEAARADELELRVTAARNALDAALVPVNSVARDAAATFVVRQVPAPAYQLPKDPVVLLTGSAAVAGERYGEDGADHPEGLLVCGVSTAGPAVIATRSAVEALRAACAAVAPDAASILWTGPAWHPVLLEWEVEFFPAPGGNLDPSDRRYRADYVSRNYELPDGEPEMVLKPGGDVPGKAANVYSGSTILSPAAQPVLSARVLRYLRGSMLPAYNEGRDPPLTADEFGRDPSPVLDWYDLHGAERRLKTLGAVYRHLAAHERANLAQSLGGFTEALLMRKLVRQLPIADPLGFPPYQRFAADVAAAVGDDTTHAPQPMSDFNPIRAGALRLLRLRIVGNFGTTYDVDVSRVGTSTQLRAPGRPDWVAMPPRLAQPARMTARWLDAEHEIEEMNNLPETSPICGWLLPDLLGGGLAIYSADGTAAGTLSPLPDPADERLARWDAAPGATGFTNVHLARVATWLRGLGPEGLAAFADTVEETLEAIEPEDASRHRGQAPLAGRPVAVARCEVGLDLMGRPAVHQDWNVFRQDLRRHSREDDDFPLVRFPVRVGERGRLNDGVLGYWIEDAVRHLGTGFHDVLDSGPFEQAVNLPPTRLTLLLDPRGGAHVTSGVLPGVTLKIPPEHYLDALAGMEVDFFTAPVLSGAGAPGLPLPSEPGYAWFWRERDGEDWTRTPVDPSRLDEHFPDVLLAREGWLALRPADQEGM